MRAQAMPGEDPETLPHPSEIAAKHLAAGQPDADGNRADLQAKHNRFVAYRQPE